MVKYVKCSKQNSRVKNAQADYSGGGIFVFRGELVDGSHFIASDADFDIRLVKSDPLKTDDWGEVEWQEENLIKDVQGKEKISLFKEILEHCIKNADYYADDLKEDLTALEG